MTHLLLSALVSAGAVNALANATLNLNRTPGVADMASEETLAARALEGMKAARDQRDNDEQAIEFLDHATPEQTAAFLRDQYGLTDEDAPGADYGNVRALLRPASTDTGLQIEVNSAKVPYPDGQYLTARAPDGSVLGPWPVSTGGLARNRDGRLHDYVTPTGHWDNPKPLAISFSAAYKNSPMPHALFFIGYKYAIHGTHDERRLGTAASHGCVRLSLEHAAQLYALALQYLPDVHISIY